jgi:hypothetical protein
MYGIPNSTPPSFAQLSRKPTYSTPTQLNSPTRPGEAQKAPRALHSRGFVVSIRDVSGVLWNYFFDFSGFCACADSRPSFTGVPAGTADWLAR